MFEFRYPISIDAAEEMGQWLVENAGDDWDSTFDNGKSMDIIISVKDEEIAALFLLKFGGIIFKK